jgi:radical SAM protein with 4Fe4S-binding SPASM domain
MDPKRKFFLFKKSENFCSVPWNHFHVWSDGKIKTCTHGKAFGNINQQSLDQLLLSHEILAIKQDLLNDKPNSNCQHCHISSTKQEHFDLRNHYNPMFSSSKIDYDDLTSFKLHGIDLHWDNTCNFKCVYCNPEQSSLIAQEQGLQPNRVDNDNVDKIIELVVENQYNIKEVYFSGGEPLLVKNNEKLLSQITNENLPIRINSNISQANNSNRVLNQLKRFKNVLWTVSAESSHERFEYTRSNGNWEKFIDNLEFIKSLGHQVRLNSVFFVGSAAYLFDTLEYFITEHGIKDITINQLYNHPYLHVKHCPPLTKQLALSKLKKILASDLIEPKSNSYYNIARCEKELLKSPNNELDYQHYFDKLDSVRHSNWREIFPELVK